MTSCSMWQSSFMKAEPEGIINTSYNQKLNLCEDSWWLGDIKRDWSTELKLQEKLVEPKNLIPYLWILHFHMQIIGILP